MILTINISEKDIPKMQSIMDISLHFLDGQLVEYTAPSGWDVEKQEPCEDAISRQAALDAFNAFADEVNQDTDIHEAIEIVLNLPPVILAQKMGRWITQWNMAHQKEYYYCSECREEFSYDGETGIKMNDYKYCPNCGVKMQEVEE